MKKTLSILIIFFPLVIFCQEKYLTENLWCFDTDKMDSIQPGEIMEAHIFMFDNYPLKFKKNGRYKKINPPLKMCSKTFKSSKNDKIKGSWSLTQDTLMLVVENKKITFEILKMSDNQIVLKVIEIS